MRPLHFALAALLLGVFCVVFGVVPLSLSPGFCLSAAFVSLLGGMVFLMNNRRGTAPCFLLAVSCLGAFQTQRSLLPGTSEVSFWADGPSFWVRGVIVSPVESRPRNGCAFVLRADVVNDYQKTWPVTGKISVYAPLPENETEAFFAAGDAVWVRGKLVTPSAQTNPDGFDETQFLARKGIRSLLSVRRMSDIRGAANDAQSVGLTQKAALWVRTGAEKIINAHLPQNEAGLLNGLLLSNRSHLEGDTREDFVRTGTIHILSVSGLHIAALAYVLQFLLFRLGLRRNAVAVVTICVLAFAALAAGGSAASVRAVVCASLVLAAPLLRRTSVDPSHTLLVAAFGLVFLDPLILFDAGAQLSFATVGALLLVMPLLSRWLMRNAALQTPVSRFGRFVAQALAVGLVAELANGPLTAYHFNRVSLIGPLANLGIVPLVEGLVAGGMTTALLSSVLPDFLTAPLWGLLHLGLSLLQNMARVFGAIPYISPSVQSPPVFFLWAYYLILGGTAIYARKRWNQKTFFAPDTAVDSNADALGVPPA